MNEDNNNIRQQLDDDDAAIDFKALFAALLKHKLAYTVSLTVAAVVGIVIALSLPPYYTCQVTLAPELASGSSGAQPLSRPHEFC